MANISIFINKPNLGWGIFKISTFFPIQCSLVCLRIWVDYIHHTYLHMRNKYSFRILYKTNTGSVGFRLSKIFCSYVQHLGEFLWTIFPKTKKNRICTYPAVTQSYTFTLVALFFSSFSSTRLRGTIQLVSNLTTLFWLKLRL